MLLTDWRNTIAMLALGIGLGSLFYLLAAPAPTLPMDYVGRLPTVIPVVVGGSLFKFKYSLDRIEQSLPAPGSASRDVSIAPENLGRLYRQLSEGQRVIERGLQVITMTLDEVGAKEIDPAGFRYLHASRGLAHGSGLVRPDRTNTCSDRTRFAGSLSREW